jgi:hypothetical protein
MAVVGIGRGLAASRGPAPRPAAFARYRTGPGGPREDGNNRRAVRGEAF